MNQSFQTLYTKLQEITDNSTGSATAGQRRRFEQDINDTQSIVCAMKGGKWKFLEKTATEASTASGSSFDLPADCRKVISVKVTVGTTDYLPRGIESSKIWDHVDALNFGNSDRSLFWHQRGNDLLVAPAFSSANATITYTYRKRVKEMTADDYSTGSIVSISNAAKALVGTGTTWTNAMEGRWIRIRGTNGDGQWYELETFGTTTTFTLAKEYQGDTIASATDAYVIGEMPVMPSEYHSLLLWRPLAIYYTMNENLLQAASYWKMYDGGFEAGLSPEVGGLLGVMLEEEREGEEGAIVDSYADLE
ncbi:MAG: hypothetical protein AAB456_01335, partial [Patescibacteria group bacterium]